MSEIITEYPDGLYILRQSDAEDNTSLMWLTHIPKNSDTEKLIGLVTMNEIINLIKNKSEMVRSWQ